MMIKLLMELIRMFLNRPRIPYPEESADFSATLESVDVHDVIDSWYDTYKPPISYFLASIVIEVSLKYPYAGCCEQAEKHIYLRPEYANAGTLAHEVAHVVYYILTDEQKQAFFDAYKLALETDSLLQLLYSKKNQSMYNTTEIHGEIYRYLGNKLPKELYIFYPYLI